MDYPELSSQAKGSTRNKPSTPVIEIQRDTNPKCSLKFLLRYILMVLTPLIVVSELFFNALERCTAPIAMMGQL